MLATNQDKKYKYMTTRHCSNIDCGMADNEIFMTQANGRWYCRFCFAELLGADTFSRNPDYTRGVGGVYTYRGQGLVREIRREPQREERINYCSSCISISGGILLIGLLLKWYFG